MQTVGITERILDTLRGLVDHHSSSRCVAEQMGQAHNYVARILRGETKLRLDVLERILETLGVPHQLFMQMVLAGQPGQDDAVDLLTFLAGDGQLAHPFLCDIRPTLDVLLRMPLVDDPAFLRQTDTLDSLEALRRSDREGAESGLEAVIFELLTDPPVPVPRQLLEDLTIALAIYGTVQRFLGRPADSGAAFRAAFPLATRSERPLALAHVYRKAAYLVRDFGHGDVGIRFLEAAREQFLRAGDMRRCVEIFTDRAVFYGNLGELELARQDFESAVSLLPADERWQRHAAYSGLSKCFEQMGRLREALAAADQAEALHEGQKDLGYAFLVWNRAKLAAGAGEGLLAEEGYRQAIDLLAEFSEPVDAALCALDLAALLFEHSQPAALRRLADEMLEWLPAFRSSRVADAVIVELIRYAKWGELSSQALMSARERLERVRAS